MRKIFPARSSSEVKVRMRPGTIHAILMILAVAGTAGSECAIAAAPTDDAVTVTWEHRHATFNYFGTTTAYNCDALASQVGRILMYFGARKNPKVSARGCPLERPSHDAWVDADFEVPLPSGDHDATGGVPARWNRVELNARKPAFMDSGDCELIQDLRELVLGNFHLRKLDYSTSCFPHALTLDDFSVTGEAPKVIAAK
jgi:hypothetical protein